MLLKQPKGLYLLFFTELWERFGNMSLQTIFVLYLSHVFHFTDKNAYLLLGAFGALLWLSPVPGGYLADRFFGFQRAIMIGGVLLVIGYLVATSPTKFWFLTGLALLVLGNGLFKPNVSSIVGALYEPGDPRRDSGFTIFYMGINLGTLLPPLFIGHLVNNYGWYWGFVLSALGMVLSLLIFILGRKRLQLHGTLPVASILREPKQVKRFSVWFFLGVIALVFVCHGALLVPRASNILMILATITIIIVLVRITLKLEKKDRQNMLVCIILTAISIGFWSIYMQCFSSFMLFADRNLDLHFLGHTINPEFTQAFNPFFIIVLSPLMSILWPWLSRKKLNPSYPIKFALGTLLMALGLLVLALAIKLFNNNGYTSTWWLVMSYFLQTVGELVLSPIGLAMITALTPQRYVGMMMGIWFLALAAAYAFGGELATLAAVPANSTILQSQAVYVHAFFDYGLIGAALTVVALFAAPHLKRMITH